MGSDEVNSALNQIDSVFQSTLPAWGATRSGRSLPSKGVFQSTLPAWGATMAANHSRSIAQNISIHAPRMGSDRDLYLLSKHWRYFNPRSPHGERRAEICAALIDVLISIHAPRMGSDFVACASVRIHGDFNPRSPHGERLALSFFMDLPNLFQSTLPAWGATFSGLIPLDLK